MNAGRLQGVSKGRGAKASLKVSPSDSSRAAAFVFWKGPMANEEPLRWAEGLLLLVSVGAAIQLIASLQSPVVVLGGIALLAGIAFIAALVLRTLRQLQRASVELHRDVSRLRTDFAELSAEFIHAVEKAVAQTHLHNATSTGLPVIMFGDCGGRSCAVFADGSVVAETLIGQRRFASVGEAEEFVGSKVSLRPVTR